ncbi:hypothetical protein GS893_24635, partial [Rhodococcus hoagii]|nr:hypothetical protein [Prescottella equi]
MLTAKEVWEATMPISTSSEHFRQRRRPSDCLFDGDRRHDRQADRNKDGIVTLAEAKETLEVGHRNVLAAA